MTSTTHVQKESPPHPPAESPLVNILFNILLPVMILEQVGKRAGEQGPTIALVVALAFPIGYGIYDWFTRHTRNWLSLLGVVNILFTGGLALLKLEGLWFAVKEAAFPLLLGAAVFATSFTRTPFIKIMACNPSVLNMPVIEARLRERGLEAAFERHLVTGNYLLTLSFVLSSILNFGLARWIFTDLAPGLSELERTTALNDQIARMTWMSFLVIVLPLMIFMMLILWHLVAGIRRMTGLELGDIFVSKPTA